MKKSVFLLCFILINFSAKAQKIDLLLSPEQNDELSSPEVFGMNEQSFFIISSKTEHSFSIESLTNKELRRIYKKQIILPEIDGKTNTFENILYFNSHIYLFSSHHDKKLKKYTVYINEISASGDLSLNHTIIDEVTFNEKNYSCKFKFALSSDSNRVLAFREFSESSSTKGRIAYKVISKGLKAIYSKEIELSQALDKTNISNVILDDEQNLYYTEKQYLKNETESGEYTKLFVVSYKAEDDTLYQTEINLNEKRFMDVHLQLNPQVNLICTGNYSTEKNYGINWENIHCMKGVFYTILESEKLNIIAHAHQHVQDLFPDEKLYYYHLTNSYSLDTDYLVLLCESQNTICNDGNCNTQFGSVIETVFHIKEQQVVTTQKITNAIKTEKPNCKGGTMSFIPFHKNNTIHLLYNCNKQFHIDSKGKITEKSIFDNSANTDLAFMKYSYQINTESMLLLSYSKKTGNRFAKISFKE